MVHTSETSRRYRRSLTDFLLIKVAQSNVGAVAQIGAGANNLSIHAGVQLAPPRKPAWMLGTESVLNGTQNRRPLLDAAKQDLDPDYTWLKPTPGCLLTRSPPGATSPATA
jgi:hypothetical protein